MLYKNSEQLNQPLYILLPRRPARGDAHDGHIALLFPEAHGDVCGKVGELIGTQCEEDLVRGRVGGECIALLRERRTDAVSHGDRVRAAALIEAVREEGVELDAEDASLRQQRAALLDDGEEVRHGIRFREDNRLAEECTALRPADVERIAEARDGGERQLAYGTAEGVCEPRAVEEERNPICAADGADDLELIHRIERAVLGRVRDVDHAGAYHVVVVCILVKGAQALLDGARGELALRVREGEHLVTAALDCARLVHGDMPRIGGNDALVGAQQRRDHDAVDLRAARQEVNLCVRCAACLADLLPRHITVLVQSIACGLLHVRLDEALQDLRMRALHIVRAERKHFIHHMSSLCILIVAKKPCKFKGYR